MPGMTASTQIIVDKRNDVLRVPNQALRYVPGGLSAVQAAGIRAPSTRQPQIWVLRGGQPVAVTVTPGLSDDNFTEIVDGDLHVGDQIIIAESGGQGNGQSLRAAAPLRWCSDVARRLSSGPAGPQGRERGPDFYRRRCQGRSASRHQPNGPGRRVLGDHGLVGLGQVDAYEYSWLPRPADEGPLLPRGCRCLGAARTGPRPDSQRTPRLRLPELQPAGPDERHRECRSTTLLRCLGAEGPRRALGTGACCAAASWPG